MVTRPCRRNGKPSGRDEGIYSFKRKHIFVSGQGLEHTGYRHGIDDLKSIFNNGFQVTDEVPTGIAGFLLCGLIGMLIAILCKEWAERKDRCCDWFIYCLHRHSDPDHARCRLCPDCDRNLMLLNSYTKKCPNEQASCRAFLLIVSLNTMHKDIYLFLLF